MTSLSPSTLPNLILNRAFRGFFLFLIFSLGGLYIFQVSAMAQETHRAQLCQERLEGLTQENEKMEANFAATRSMENLELLVNNLNFENVDRIHYIRVTSGPIVAK